MPITKKQKEFAKAFAEAIAEHKDGKPIDQHDIGCILFGLQAAGILLDTTDCEEADAIMCQTPGIILQPKKAPREPNTYLQTRGYTKRGWVYVLSNESFPGLLKIGMTTNDIEARMRQLATSTGVPTPFQLLHAEPAEHAPKLEAELHDALDCFRVPSGREFFRCDLKQVIAAISSIKQVAK